MTQSLLRRHVQADSAFSFLSLSPMSQESEKWQRKLIAGASSELCRIVFLALLTGENGLSLSVQ